MEGFYSRVQADLVDIFTTGQVNAAIKQFEPRKQIGTVLALNVTHCPAQTSLSVLHFSPQEGLFQGLAAVLVPSVGWKKHLFSEAYSAVTANSGKASAHVFHRPGDLFLFHFCSKGFALCCSQH